MLLDDATRLAAKAAADDVAVILDITPGVPHVFQAFDALLEEGHAALDRGRPIRQGQHRSAGCRLTGITSPRGTSQKRAPGSSSASSGCPFRRTRCCT